MVDQFHGESRSGLRKHLLDQRRSASLDDRQQWDLHLSQQVLAWCSTYQPARLGVYWPIQAEPDLRTCYAQLHNLGIQLALPIVVGKDKPLSFATWQPGDAMEQDDYGIAIPKKPWQFLQPQVLLIPCVGFNSQHFRLGYGGGFYDRTLALTPRPKTVGVAYALAKTEFIASAHDVALDLILTEMTENYSA